MKKVKNRSQIKNPRTGLYVKRDTTSGQFTKVKVGGGPFENVKIERPQRKKANRKRGL